jgi:colicin import membrane protein
MAERNESSAFYSLTELMDLERERVAAEAALLERRAREERERREREAQAAREAEARRLREAEENQRAVEQRQREEAARLEAIREAELERARAEAEQRARAEAEALQRAHRAALEELREESAARPATLAVFGAVTLLGAGLAVLGFQWQQAQQRAIRERAAASAERQHLSEESARIVQEIQQLRQQVTETAAQTANSEAELSGVKSEAERRALLDEQRQRETRLKSAGKPNVDKGHRPQQAAKGCDCTPGDPLCSCL